MSAKSNAPRMGVAAAVTAATSLFTTLETPKMANSTCPKCASTRFEMKEHKPAGSKFPIMFVQCANCGAVVGITDFHNVPLLLERMARQIGFDLFA